MLPYLYDSGGAQLPSYGVLVLLAFVLAFALAHGRARQVGIGVEAMIPVYVAAAVGGLAGAKLLYMAALAPSKLFTDPAALFTGGGFAFYGGLLGGAVGVFAWAAWRRLPGWKLADVLAAPLVLGLGVGRVGCLLAGCCHGAEAHLGSHARPLLADGPLHGQLWWDGSFPFLATEFHAGVGRLHEVPLYPTQLWSAVAGLGLAAVLATWWNHRRFDGQIVGLMLVLEPLFRIGIEAFRADHRGYLVSFPVADPTAWPPGMVRAGADLPGVASTAVVGLTTSQGIGLAMMAVGLAILVLRRGAGVAPETPLDEEL